MALHNSFKQGQSQQPENHLSAVPTADELGSALSQARKGGKRPIVLSWKSQKSNNVFWLSVTAGGAGNEAEWLLQKGAEGTQPKDVWNHKTTDTTLIQSLISAEEEIAFKSGSRAIIPPNNTALDQQAPPAAGFNSSSDPWSNAGSAPGAPIMLGGNFQSPPQRPDQQSGQGWQASEVSGWNSPQPAPEQLGWGQRSTPPPQETSGAYSNPFAALKGTVEEPKPVNLFTPLMSNPALPQLPPQKMPGNLPEKKFEPAGQSQSSSQNPVQNPNSGQFAAQNQRTSSGQLPSQSASKFAEGDEDSPANPYDALTNSNQGLKTMPAVKPPPPPPAPPKSDSPSGSFPQQPSGKVPSVPNFAAMTTSGAYPVVNVSPDQALNPKQAGKGMAINQISARPGSQNQQTTQKNAPAVTPPAGQAGGSAKQLPPPVELDRAAVDGVFKTLSNQETGLLNHGSMLFFLVREFSRYQVNNEPFSLIIMEMHVMISGSTGAQLPRPLPPRAVRAAAQKILALTRQLDLVSHYEQSDYAILLPATNRKQANEFAQSVSKALLSQPLTPDMEPKALILRMGVASFPEDTSHPGILLAAAGEAKIAAIKSNKPIVLFSET